MTEQGTRMVFLGANRKPCMLPQKCPLPEVKEGEILIKIRLATICGSDIHTINGMRNEATPSVLGHEAVGEVVTSNRRNSSLKPGDRVTFSIISCCQQDQCTRCKNGIPQKCLHVKKYGHLALTDGSGFNGCYASHLLLDKNTCVFKIPANVKDKVAAPINCALATIINAITSIPTGFPSSVAVVQGAGLLGIYACAFLRDRGFKKVFCTDVNTYRLSKVSSFGGTPIGPGYPEEIPQESSVDVVLEVCGSPDVVTTGVYLLKPGGIYLLVGMVHPNSKLDITGEQIIRKCLTLKGVHNYRPSDLEEAVNFIAKTATVYPFEDLIGSEYPLESVEDAIVEANSQRHWRVAIRP